jgi:hypothetical protein
MEVDCGSWPFSVGAMMGGEQEGAGLALALVSCLP